MLVYECEHCGQLTFGGFENEYDQHFCREKCCEEYCNAHGYAPCLSNLKQVRTPFD